MSRSSSRRVVVRVVDHYDDKTRTKAAWFLLESSVASGDAEEKPAQKGTDFCFWVWVGSLQLELYWFGVFGLIGGERERDGSTCGSTLGRGRTEARCLLSH